MEDLLDYEMEQYDIMSPVGITFGAFQVHIYWMMYIHDEAMVNHSNWSTLKEDTSINVTPLLLVFRLSFSTTYSDEKMLPVDS